MFCMLAIKLLIVWIRVTIEFWEVERAVEIPSFRTSAYEKVSWVYSRFPKHFWSLPAGEWWTEVNLESLSHGTDHIQVF